MEHFNKLTPAEAERLALLIEECSEAIQAAAKILRHGYESRHPDRDENNRYDLEIECGHIRHAMIRLCDYGDLDKSTIHYSAHAKSRNVIPYLHHYTAEPNTPPCYGNKDHIGWCCDEKGCYPF